MKLDKIYEILKDFFYAFFEWVRPKMFSKRYFVKDMSFQSWMVKTLKSPTTTTTVIWHFSTKIPIHFWFFGYYHWVATQLDKKNEISFLISISLEDKARQSRIGQTPEKVIYPVLSDITVAPFLKETGQNSWDSEKNLCFFECDRPKIFSPNCVKDMSFQS